MSLPADHLLKVLNDNNSDDNVTYHYKLGIYLNFEGLFYTMHRTIVMMTDRSLTCLNIII